MGADHNQNQGKQTSPAGAAGPSGLTRMFDALAAQAAQPTSKLDPLDDDHEALQAIAFCRNTNPDYEEKFQQIAKTLCDAMSEKGLLPLTHAAGKGDQQKRHFASFVDDMMYALVAGGSVHSQTYDSLMGTYLPVNQQERDESIFCSLLPEEFFEKDDDDDDDTEYLPGLSDEEKDRINQALDDFEKVPLTPKQLEDHSFVMTAAAMSKAQDHAYGYTDQNRQVLEAVFVEKHLDDFAGLVAAATEELLVPDTAIERLAQKAKEDLGYKGGLSNTEKIHQARITVECVIGQPLTEAILQHRDRMMGIVPDQQQRQNRNGPALPGV